jgi:hypothetical protein
MSSEGRITAEWETVQIGEALPSYEYVLTQTMVDAFRASVEDPEASFPTLSVRADTTAFYRKYDDIGSVNARCAFHCYNPPVAGKRIRVTAWIADKYMRRGKPYFVTEAISIDEDGRLIDRVITHELKRPSEVGKKWNDT